MATNPMPDHQLIRQTIAARVRELRALRTIERALRQYAKDCELSARLRSIKSPPNREGAAQ